MFGSEEQWHREEETLPTAVKVKGKPGKRSLKYKRAETREESAEMSCVAGG